MNKNTCALILAAGDGKRMKSDKSKVLHRVLFKPMAEWVFDTCKASFIEDICLVTGHLGDQVEEYFKDKAFFAVQNERKGTGHAVAQAEKFLQRHAGGRVLVLAGDAPLISKETICSALDAHIKGNHAVTVISAEVPNPKGYGRIMRANAGLIHSIVEEKDADAKTKLIKEVNSGAYWFQISDLLGALSHLTNTNNQGEYYLTQAIEVLENMGKRCGVYCACDPDEILGANDRIQLLQLGQAANHRIIRAHMQAGVSFPSLDTVVIGPDVTIGRDTEILLGTIIRGKVNIGKNCIIGPNTVIEDSEIGNNCVIPSSFISNSTLASGTKTAAFSNIINIESKKE